MMDVYCIALQRVHVAIRETFRKGVTRATVTRSAVAWPIHATPDSISSGGPTVIARPTARGPHWNCPSASVSSPKCQLYLIDLFINQIWYQIFTIIIIIIIIIIVANLINFFWKLETLFSPLLPILFNWFIYQPDLISDFYNYYC